MGENIAERLHWVWNVDMEGDSAMAKAFQQEQALPSQEKEVGRFGVGLNEP